MFDQNGIIDHVQELEQSLSDWERYQKITLEEFRNSRDTQNMVLHALLISIQSAIDIANHVIAENKLNRPSTYRECFDILANAGMLPSDLASQLADLAGFRNILVHLYCKLNLDEIHQILMEDLLHLKRYLSWVKEHLKSKVLNE
ncbi:MAG: type VII toxin-antitoxin system HepT family RNase toxin [Candidatus Helarchaeales archaeon]